MCQIETKGYMDSQSRVMKGNKSATNRKAKNSHGCHIAFAKVMDAYSALPEVPQGHLLDFKMDVEAVMIATLPQSQVVVFRDVYTSAWSPDWTYSQLPLFKELASLILGVRWREVIESIGKEFITRKLYPTNRYFTCPKYPAMYVKGNSHLSSIASLFQANGVGAPELLGLDLPKTEEWLMAHGITHVDFDGLNLHYEGYRTGPPKSGYTYFMHDPDKKVFTIKIGFADDPDERLKDLKTGCPRLRLLLKIRTKDMVETEAYFHTRFAEWRQKADDGGKDPEWFLPSDELVKFLAKHDVKI